jgi:hypothetical protein
MTTAGAPPPLRGHTAGHLLRFALACRSSAIVLDLQGHPDHATHLRALATAADTRAAQRPAAAPVSLPRAA